MALKKITELPDGTAIAAADLIPVVDVSDTSSAETGTTKQYTVLEHAALTILAADEKTTPIDADKIGMVDSAASNVLRYLSFLNLFIYVSKKLNPIGTIREFNVATNPATLLGFGTWTAYGAGRVTVGFDAGQTEFDTVDKTGGEKTHLLLAAESGEKGHNHTQNEHTHGFDQTTLIQDTGDTANRYALASGGGPAVDVTSAGTIATNQAVAASNAASAHNNLQPYVVCYRWVRVS